MRLHQIFQTVITEVVVTHEMSALRDLFDSVFPLLPPTSAFSEIMGREWGAGSSAEMVTTPVAMRNGYTDVLNISISYGKLLHAASHAARTTSPR